MRRGENPPVVRHAHNRPHYRRGLQQWSPVSGQWRGGRAWLTVLALVVIAGVLAAAPTAPAAPRKPAAPPSAPAPGAPSPVLRIATFNLENLFDRYDDPYTADSSDDRGTQPKPARALFAVDRKSVV